MSEFAYGVQGMFGDGRDLLAVVVLNFVGMIQIDADGDYYLWVGGEERFNPEGPVILLQAFFEKFRPKDHAVLCYSRRCSKPYPDEFCGGAVFVSKDDTEWFDAAYLADRYARSAASPQTSLLRFVVYDPSDDVIVDDRLFRTYKQARRFLHSRAVQEDAPGSRVTYFAL